MIPIIRAAATANGVDPDTAVRVAKQEGLVNPIGDQKRSGGAFQLFTGGGLGNEYEGQTGYSPLDLSHERESIWWAMQNVKRTGWEPYHGAAKAGIGNWQGIGTPPRPTAAPPAMPPAPGDLPIDDMSKQANLPTGEGFTPQGLLVHHTGGGRNVGDVVSTLQQRGLSVQYVIDREGNVHQLTPEGRKAFHAGDLEKSAGALGNQNLLGVEVIAKGEKDVTDLQRARIAQLNQQLSRKFGYDPASIYGHGELTGRKEPDEGATAKTIREGILAQQRQPPAALATGATGTNGGVNVTVTHKQAPPDVQVGATVYGTGLNLAAPRVEHQQFGGL
jgi:hypothetical protein